MKRSRTVSKSTESVSSGKDEPPKKIAKKRVKSAAQPQVDSSPVVRTPISTPIIKPGTPFNSASKLGSLPMYGEHLPEDGYDSIPALAERTCDNLRVIMAKIRDAKLKCSGGSKVINNGCSLAALSTYVGKDHHGHK